MIFSSASRLLVNSASTVESRARADSPSRSRSSSQATADVASSMALMALSSSRRSRRSMRRYYYPSPGLAQDRSGSPDGASFGNGVLSAIGQDLFERGLVAVDHRLDAESLFYVLPAAIRIYLLQTPTRYRPSHLVPLTLADQNTYLTVLDDLRCRAHGVRHDRSSAGQRFGHHQPERFFPLDGEEQEARTREQLLLARAVYLALVDDVLSVDKRLDALLEVMGVHSRV